MSVTSWWYTQGRRLWVVLGSGSVLMLMGWKEDGHGRKGWSSAWKKVYRRGVQRAWEKNWLNLRWGRALWVASCHKHTLLPWATTEIWVPVGFFPFLHVLVVKNVLISPERLSCCPLLRSVHCWCGGSREDCEVNKGLSAACFSWLPPRETDFLQWHFTGSFSSCLVFHL